MCVDGVCVCMYGVCMVCVWCVSVCMVCVCVWCMFGVCVQGEIQQLLIIPDPRAAESYCEDYIPDCHAPLPYDSLSRQPEEVSDYQAALLLSILSSLISLSFFSSSSSLTTDTCVWQTSCPCASSLPVCVPVHFLSVCQQCFTSLLTAGDQIH